MIRVLQVIGVMDRGGAETMIMNLYRAINRSEIQFDFLVHEQREGDYDAEIRDFGGRIFRIPRFNGLNYSLYRRCVRAFFEEHRGYSIVHGHIGSCAPIYLAEAKRAGCYTIAHSHSQNFYKGLLGVAFNLFSQPVRGVADFYFGCSREAGIDRFGPEIVNSSSFHVLPNGIDATRYVCDQATHEEAKSKLGFTGRPIICHVGRFIPVKNHAFLFNVFAHVLEDVPNAVLLLAGRGELEEPLRELAEELKISNSVSFLGVVDDVSPLLRASDIFVFPSIKEGLPLAVVEAQAAGLSTVVSSGVPELAIMSDDAYRVPLSDGVLEWARLCVELIEATNRKPRHDGVFAVREHGFDITETSAWLAAFYQNAAKHSMPQQL